MGTTHSAGNKSHVGGAMSDDATYQACTRAITVSVEPVYLESESSPEDHHFVWAYHVRIENRGADTVQLRNRYWRITDSLGRVHEVRGAGVVGEQPILQPGEAYEYSSGTPLDTPSGFMVGTYEMQNTRGEVFDVAVPAFSLDLPDARAQLH